VEFPRKLLIVIAGNHQQYADWLSASGEDPCWVRYVHKTSQLQGLSASGIEFVHTGEYWKNAVFACTRVERLIADGATVRKSAIAPPAGR